MEHWLQRNVRLAPFTTWKIGGPAAFFAVPEDLQTLAAAQAWAVKRDLPVWYLGRGSNLLIDDAGLPGLTLCLRKLQQPELELTAGGEGEPATLTVPSGISLPRMAKQVAAAGFTGYEFYIGIPGTVGGAVVMNAGFGPGDERQTANRCHEVCLLNAEGAAVWHPYSDFRPRYRATDLQGSGRLVIGARFTLRKSAPPEAIRHETALHLAMRKRMQPLTRPTAGSVFKGTAEGVPAGKLIDDCGLKGLRIGDAQVSEKHANWIENLGRAKASDVRQLIKQVQEQVQSATGIRLEPEVHCLPH